MCGQDELFVGAVAQRGRAPARPENAREPLNWAPCFASIDRNIESEFGSEEENVIYFPVLLDDVGISSNILRIGPWNL